MNIRKYSFAFVTSLVFLILAFLLFFQDAELRSKLHAVKSLHQNALTEDEDSNSDDEVVPGGQKSPTFITDDKLHSLDYPDGWSIEYSKSYLNGNNGAPSYPELLGSAVDEIKLSKGDYTLILNEKVPTTGGHLCVFEGQKYWGEVPRMGAWFHSINDAVYLRDTSLIRYDSAKDENKVLRYESDGDGMSWKICEASEVKQDISTNANLRYELGLTNFSVDYLTPKNPDSKILSEMDAILISVQRLD